MAINREIKYLNQDFSGYRANLINYAQTYFPNSYTDFSPTSPGMMFMEMSAYVGDVLTYYINNQIQENFLQYSRQTSNIYDSSPPDSISKSNIYLTQNSGVSFCVANSIFSSRCSIFSSRISIEYLYLFFSKSVFVTFIVNLITYY